MPVFYKEGKTILFIHIPKTGGTFVEALFKRNGYEIEFLAHGNNRGFLNTVMHISPQHLHLNVLENIFDLSKFDFIFTVVRNPIDRFKSEYRMRNPDGKVPINAWGERVMERFETNPGYLDNHLRPQVDFINSHVHWYKLENKLDEAWIQNINEQFNLNLINKNLRPLNKSSTEDNSRQHGEISESLKAAIHTYYHQDFEAFQYGI